MKSTSWVLIDTETTGLRSPVRCVEIAAQRMRGMTPEGHLFRRLLNHDVELESGAVRLHGYTREFLAENGEDPMTVYSELATYVGGAPVVSFNLSYDWNRVLRPEYEYLGIDPIGRPGFCALTLARRCLSECDTHKLASLAERYFPGYHSDRHSAEGDVRTTARLIAEVMWPRLERANVVRFDDVLEFSKLPISKCVERLREFETLIAPECESPDIEAVAELNGMVRGILADNLLVPAELDSINEWFIQNDRPLSPSQEALKKSVRQIWEDGMATGAEVHAIQTIMRAVLRGSVL